MKMRKIVAIAAAVLMLFSVIPFSAMAADTTVVFELGANGSASHNYLLRNCRRLYAEHHRRYQDVHRCPRR